VRVCGCDGQIYGALCEAAAANVDLSPSACGLLAGEFACGYGICTLETDFCVAIAGGPLQQPQFDCGRGCSPPSCECALSLVGPGNCTCSAQNGAIMLQCGTAPAPPG
jgi:hypothetical protein